MNGLTGNGSFSLSVYRTPGQRPVRRAKKAADRMTKHTVEQTVGVSAIREGMTLMRHRCDYVFIYIHKERGRTISKYKYFVSTYHPALLLVVAEQMPQNGVISLKHFLCYWPTDSTIHRFQFEIKQPFFSP